MELLFESDHLGSKPAKSPMEEHLKLSAHQGEVLIDFSMYRRLVGKLLYLTVFIGKSVFSSTKTATSDSLVTKIPGPSNGGYF